MATSSTSTDQVAPRGALSKTDQLDQRSYSDDPQDGGDADARAGSSETFTAESGDPIPSGSDPAPQGKDGISEALKAERRRSNNLEKELRGLRQQLTRFSEINPKEYSRLQEAERQKQLLEQQVELRERQMEEASAQKVAAVAAARDEASTLVRSCARNGCWSAPSQKRRAATAETDGGRSLMCSRASWVRAFASAPARTAPTCSNRSMVRANPCWGMTAGR